MVRKTSRLRAAAAIGALCCALTGCSGEAEAPPEPEPEVLSASQAGGVYLDAVCPVNAAWDEADVMGEVADARERAAERLETKQQEWPRGTETAVEAVRDTLESDRKQARKVAKLDAADAVGYAWLGAEESAAAAAGARTALGLPEDPIAACAQWEERSH
jgi:hypothetical protein